MIDINIDGVKDNINIINSKKKYLISAIDDVRYTKNKVSNRVQQKNNISSRLSRAIIDINDLNRKTSNLYSALDYAIANYEKCERDINYKADITFNGEKSVNYSELIQEMIGSLGSLSTLSNDYAEQAITWFKESGKKISETVHTLGKSSGNYGTVFSMASGVISFNSNIRKMLNDPSTVGGATTVSLLKHSKKIIESIYKVNSSEAKLARIEHMASYTVSKARMDRLFGVDDLFKGGASKAGKWGKRFSTNFEKRWESSFSKTKNGGAKAAFKWAGAILTIAERGFQNKDEYETGTISYERAVAETAMESVISIGINAAVGAAVASGIAATAIGSAPVLLVAGGTAVVMVGLESASKYVTNRYFGEEKGLVEATSDGILDSMGFLKNKFNQVVNCFNNPNKTPKALWSDKVMVV